MERQDVSRGGRKAAGILVIPYASAVRGSSQVAVICTLRVLLELLPDGISAPRAQPEATFKDPVDAPGLPFPPWQARSFPLVLRHTLLYSLGQDGHQTHL